MHLTMLVAFIISTTECPVKFGEHMKKLYKSQNKEHIAVYKEFAPLSFPKNNTSAPEFQLHWCLKALR